MLHEYSNAPPQGVEETFGDSEVDDLSTANLGFSVWR